MTKQTRSGNKEGRKPKQPKENKQAQANSLADLARQQAASRKPR